MIPVLMFVGEKPSAREIAPRLPGSRRRRNPRLVKASPPRALRVPRPPRDSFSDSDAWVWWHSPVRSVCDGRAVAGWRGVLLGPACSRLVQRLSLKPFRWAPGPPCGSHPHPLQVSRPLWAVATGRGLTTRLSWTGAGCPVGHGGPRRPSSSRTPSLSVSRPPGVTASGMSPRGLTSGPRCVLCHLRLSSSTGVLISHSSP